jgi:hypothetical protein
MKYGGVHIKLGGVPMFDLIDTIEITTSTIAIGIFILGVGFHAVDTNAQESRPIIVQAGTTETTTQTTTFNGRAPVEIDIEFQKARLDTTQANLLKSWGDIVAADPSIAHNIARKPALLNNQSYLDQHPPLRDFVASHPDFPEQFAENPGNFVAPN